MEPLKIYEQWINDPDIDQETKDELLAIKGNEAEITDRFYMELEFGTAGLRGVIGAGLNRMNKYTVAKATQGLADYINSQGKADRGVAIACDSRHMSPEFVEITAAVLNANGIKVYVFESLRPTPELSFAIRQLNCISGVNVTASHNPAEYNGYKVYWEDGAQVTPPHDKGIMECVNYVTNISKPKMMSRAEAESKGLYVTIGADIDNEYIKAISAEIKEPDAVKAVASDMKIVYTPLHGAGIKIVPEALKRNGFEKVYIVKEQEQPDGSFPTVALPNPEMPQAFELADKLGKEVDADVIIATDPDSDRIGIHVKDNAGEYHALTGNVIGSVLCEYELSRRKAHGNLPQDGFVVRSIVSGRTVDKIAAAYGVKLTEVLTGFKYIGGEILKAEQSGQGTYLFGFEESYGFLTGTYARDKDACGTALALCDMCAYYKTLGLTAWDAVLDVYKKYGYSLEKTISVTKKGIDGMAEIQNDMKKLRENPPKAFGKYQVINSLDYNQPETTGLPKANVLYFGLENGWVAIRPSGTEPKIKYYIGVSAESEEVAKAMIAEIEASL